MKKAAIIAALLLTALAIASCSPAGTGIAPIPSGTMKTDTGSISWNLDGSGLLELSGTGSVVALPLDKTEVKEINIGEGFDKIESGAFKNMSEAVRITIPDSVKEICADAFKNCKKLESLEIPDSVEIISDSAFDGWDKTQRIIADWYEGSVEHWKEWFDFDSEFGEYFEEIKRTGDLPDELECKLSAWWQQWKDSDFWKNPSIKIGDREYDADSCFGYWSEFGSYLFSDADDGVEPRDEWWEKTKKLTEYLEESSKNIKIEIPQEIRDIIEARKDDVDAAIQYIREKKNLTREELKKGADYLRQLWEEYFGE